MFVILSKVQPAHIYSMLFDLSNKPQVTLVLRYVGRGNIHKHFIEFIGIRNEMSTNNDPEDDKEINEEQVILTGEKIG